MKTSLTLFAILGVMGASPAGAGPPAEPVPPPPLDTTAATAGLETATFALG